MRDTIFRGGKNNANADLFEIPSEEGGDEDDNFNSSIGDATLKHIEGLKQSRIIFDTFVRMPDGNLFSIEPNLSWSDGDELNLRSVKDLQVFMKQQKIPEKYEGVYKEALQNELERREESEDVLDQKENLVSFEDWEANPGMMSHLDIPQTPKPHIKYVGNCHQMFYDSFAEDHPDKKTINAVIFMLNRPWEMITPRYGKMIVKMVDDAPILASTKKILEEMIWEVVNDAHDPEEVVHSALQAIDHLYGQMLFKRVRSNELKVDPIYKYFVDMCHSFDAMIEQGTSLNKIFSTVKQMGKVLFSKKEPLKEQGIPGRLKKRHWLLYHKVKKRYAPPVMINGVNINKAYKNEIARALGVDKSDEIGDDGDMNSFEVAKKIMMARPFENMEELHRTGLITYEDIVSQSPVLNVFLERIRAASALATTEKNVKLLTGLPAEFIKEQKAQGNSIDLDAWKKIWECYNREKTRVLKLLKTVTS